MAICGMCDGGGKIRQETTVEKVKKMETVTCPRCGGWLELEGRFIDDGPGIPKRRKGNKYVDRATREGGYTWPKQNDRGKSRLNRRQNR